MASFALAGGIARWPASRRRDAAGLFGNQSILNFYGSCRSPPAAWAQPWSAACARLFQQAANRGIFAAVAVFAVFIINLLLRPEVGGAAATRAYDTAARSAGAQAPPSPGRGALPWIALGLSASPLLDDPPSASSPSALASTGSHGLNPQPRRMPSAGCRC
jgi:hypothetical protein